jgi:fluoroquinolone transport system permease protein
VFAYGGSVDWSALIFGILTMTSIFACFGFLLVARYRSINEFLFPSIFVSALLSLPVLDLLAVWPSTLWYLHPLHGPLELIGAGFEPLPGVQLGAAAAVASAWLAVIFAACVRSFHRFVAEDLRRA